MTRIKLSDGAGGEAMQVLLKNSVFKHLTQQEVCDKGEVPLTALDDSGVIDGIVFTIDGHTVRPLFYPGGDIGSLSAAGTINDISVMGARPIGLASSIVIEEGFDVEDLEKLIKSFAKTCQEAGVPIMAGDTKVVEKGSVEDIIVTTAGIGVMQPSLEANNSYMAEKGREQKWLCDSNVHEGDAIIVSGNMGDHGVGLLSFREGYGFETKIVSDTAPLNDLILKALNVGGIASAKDPTRGGLANTLNEWADKSNVGIMVKDRDIPIHQAVRSACEMLGLDPLQIGNEGKVVLAVVPEKADEVLSVLKAHPLGKDAAIIGHATKDVRGVVLETVVGGKRILEPPVGDPVPRIC